jgi:transcriptional regulator with XRE-family HTH domain
MRQPARDLIAESGRTIIGIAEEIGVKRSHLAKSLYGYCTPCQAVRNRLPQILNTPLDQLFTPELLARHYTGTRPGVRKSVGAE